MKKVVGYCRTSTSLQSTGLESQRRAITEYFASKGCDEFEIYEDFAVSGVKSSRPNLDKMMNEAREGKISLVVVYSFSRFARSTTQLLNALEEFQKLNIEFVSLSEQLDTRTPIGRALFTIISAIAALERETLIERVRLGMANARAKGKRIGRPSTIKPEVILTLFYEGYTQREIAKILRIGQSTVGRAIKKYDSKEKPSDPSESKSLESK